MNLLKIAFVIVLFLSFSTCKKDCEPTSTICSETPPTDEACLAYFVRWFYDSSSNSCTEIGYSGCEQYGFATEAECLECECD